MKFAARANITLSKNISSFDTWLQLIFWHISFPRSLIFGRSGSGEGHSTWFTPFSHLSNYSPCLCALLQLFCHWSVTCVAKYEWKRIKSSGFYPGMHHFKMSRVHEGVWLSISTYLDTREKASAHTAGHGTSLIITCSAAAWKCARVTLSSTEANVATSPAFVLGSPPAVSKMFPPCTTSISTWVLHFLCKGVERGHVKQGSERERKNKGNIVWKGWVLLHVIGY